MYNSDNSPGRQRAASGKPIHNYADRLKDLRRLDRYEVARNTLIQLIEEHQFIPSQENGYKVDITE